MIYSSVGTRGTAKWKALGWIWRKRGARFRSPSQWTSTGCAAHPQQHIMRTQVRWCLPGKRRRDSWRHSSVWHMPRCQTLRRNQMFGIKHTDWINRSGTVSLSYLGMVGTLLKSTSLDPTQGPAFLGSRPFSSLCFCFCTAHCFGQGVFTGEVLAVLLF